MDSCALHEGREKKNQVDMDTPEGWSRVMSQLLVAYPCSQYSLPGWLCPSPGDQPVCAGAVLCWGHPSVSRESPSGMLPLLPPLHYPHQATQHTQGNLRLQGRSWTMAQNPPPGCFLVDAVVAKIKLSDKTTFISLLDLNSSLEYVLSLAWAHKQPWDLNTNWVFQE